MKVRDLIGLYYPNKNDEVKTKLLISTNGHEKTLYHDRMEWLLFCYELDDKYVDDYYYKYNEILELEIVSLSTGIQEELIIEVKT